MNVLVVNCGSSSIKYSLYRMADGADDGRLVATGQVERIGEDESRAVCEAGGDRRERAVEAPDHRAGFAAVVECLTGRGGPAEGAGGDRAAGPVLEDLSRIDAVGHRVVHGAERFTESCPIDEDVLSAIEACVPLAPLHNPPNLVGIRAATERMPDVPHVAVFDTAFHQTIPPEAYLYALPYDLYAEHGVRRYGFHGTSHRYVSLEAAKRLGKPPDEANLITAHLGNGCSITAVREGRSVDTSMGLTPLEGLVMGTRSGDVDPAIVFHLARTLDMDVDAIDRMLNRESGLLGVSGVSNDMREVLAAAAEGQERAELAVAIFCRRLRKYVGAYTAVLGRVDALVFTGGIGENASAIRDRTCRGLEPLGYVLDVDRNAAREDGPRDLAAEGSARRIFVVPTDEEAMIARDTARIARGLGRTPT